MDIKFFITDVDGTLTDGKIYMGASGECFKAFNIKDGYGLYDILIKKHQVKVIVITGRRSKIVENRCHELRIEDLYQGVRNKKEKLMDIIDKDDLASVVYVGDDLNDFEVMEFVKQSGGFTACPANSATMIKSISNYVSSLNGGEGAVRDIIDNLFS